MKKLIIIFAIIICSCGIGYLGYVIFRSKNIQSVELVGNIQTLYIVGDEIDFEDAKLKVTYKNGNIKMLDLDSASINIDYFTTSVETHGVMNLIYKSKVIEIPYNVIQKGAYYLSSSEVKSVASTNTATTNSNSYTLANTVEMFYIYGEDICNYYTRSAGKWFMVDGRYSKNFTYSITADTLNIKLGNQSYAIQAEYLEDGRMILKSKILSKIQGTDLISQQEVKTFEKNNEIKLGQTVSSAQIDYDLLGSEFVEFKVGDTIKSSGKDIYLKVTYAQYVNASQFRTIYVKVDDNMITRNLDTSKSTSAQTQASLNYESISNIALFYKVVKY